MQKKILLLLALLITVLPVYSGTRGNLRAGGKLYQNEQYGQALSKYQQILKDSPQNAQASFGAGAAAYYLKDYNTAQQAFQTVSGHNGQLQQDALFNLGNTYYRAQQNEKAAEAYRQAILKNPKDKEALHNLQLVINQEQNQNSQNNQNQQNQDKNSSNQSKDEQNNQGQAPQDPKQQEQNQSQAQQQMQKEDAQRVMQIARDNEYKAPQKSGQNSSSAGVEKDW